MKKNFKSLLTFLFFAVLVNGLSLYSVAAIDGCSVEERMYQPAKHIFDFDLQRTLSNTLTGVSPVALQHGAGASPDMMMKCQGYVDANLRASGMIDDTAPDEYRSCEVTPEEEPEVEAICAALSSDVGTVQAYEVNNGRSVLVDSVNGSLIGMATSLESSVVREPLPVNFAYYWNQGVTKIPFVGRALAADNEPYDNLPVVKAVYDIWRLSLSVALALLSVVLLYTGIMITMGKKISSQLVVSVQYAIPKIVIGTILIIFSYPIGAAITSVSFGLFKGAPSIFSSLLNQNNLPGSGFLLLTLIVHMFSFAIGGSAYVFVCVLMVLILTLAKIILYLKVLMIYIKMAFSIITAPVEFVLGTIPGNDDKIKDWFMRMLKYGLTIFGMGMITPVTLWIALKIMTVYMYGGSSEGGGGGVLISIIAPLLIVIFGFGMGMGMEKRVDEMFSGGKKKR